MGSVLLLLIFLTGQSNIAVRFSINIFFLVSESFLGESVSFVCGFQYISLAVEEQ